MVYPYLIKLAPDTFVVQVGGGISTSVALRRQLQDRHRGGGKSRGARRLSHRQGIARFTGDVLNNPKVHVIDTTAGSISRIPRSVTTSST